MSIASFPAEILDIIFEDCLGVDEPAPPFEEQHHAPIPSTLSGPGTPVALSHVCSGWRVAAVGYPPLWDRIVVQSVHRKQVDGVRSFIERSFMRPLRIHLGNHYAFDEEMDSGRFIEDEGGGGGREVWKEPDEGVLETAWKYLLAESWRWRQVTLVLHQQAQRIVSTLGQFDERLDQLTSLSVRTDGWTHPSLSKLAAFLHSSPVLREVSWANESPELMLGTGTQDLEEEEDYLPGQPQSHQLGLSDHFARCTAKSWSQFTHLCLGRVGSAVTDLSPILGYCTSLDTLIIHGLDVVDTTGSSASNPLGLTNRILVPSLKELCIEGGAEYFLGMLRCPGLKTLRLPGYFRSLVPVAVRNAFQAVTRLLKHSRCELEGLEVGAVEEDVNPIGTVTANDDNGYGRTKALIDVLCTLEFAYLVSLDLTSIPVKATLFLDALLTRQQWGMDNWGNNRTTVLLEGLRHLKLRDMGGVEHADLRECVRGLGLVNRESPLPPQRPLPDFALSLGFRASPWRRPHGLETLHVRLCPVFQWRIFGFGGMVGDEDEDEEVEEIRRVYEVLEVEVAGIVCEVVRPDNLNAMRKNTLILDDLDGPAAEGTVLKFRFES